MWRACVKFAGGNRVAGVLPRAEATLVSGAGAQTALSRWGDYSMLSVDPVDDCTFWYTQEYYAAFTGTGWTTRVGSFRFPECVTCALVGQPVLMLDRVGSTTSLSWTTAQYATSYDVVTGSLSTLRSTSGSFTSSTTGCTANDVPGIGVVAIDLDPPPDDGTYYLVRATGSGCRGTYDDASGSLFIGRDPGVASSAGTCP